MKTLNIILAILLTTCVVIAQKDGDKPYMTKTFSANAIKNLKMTTSGGSLTVTGTNESEAKIEVYVRGNNWKEEISKEELEERLQNYELTISQNGNTLIAFSKNKTNNWGKKSLSIAFKAFVPTKITTDLSTSGGSISVKEIAGNAVGKTSGGSISVTNCKNKIDLKTSGGSISATNCTGDIDLITSGGSISATDLDGIIDLKTSGGSISLDNLKGKTSAITSGGSIKATELRGESIVKTSGGSIVLSEIRGTLDAATSAGSIDAEILELGTSLNLSVSSGSMNVKMPMNKGATLDWAANKINVSPLNHFQGNTEKNYIKGTLNGGGIPINLKVSSGNLTVKSL
ncbi:hypothetical protein VB796_09250 [Arcicella sp. LKC2W]|uniref:DUF4097 family beta strand repeat-containing protein n=1 Tax=Arcicella sp. LKC2W TaxID=2984198 RepID=UPI002B20C79E|nr:hypothetical protein [Arcicella sp. LKC2W]MEA5459222.1 hypothetical protein [Arcicella sp. LKC2W]